MILLTQSGYDPGRDILARCAAVSASVGAPAPMVHLLPAEAAEAPARSETYIEQVYHITQTLETNYLVNLQMDLRFLTLKLDGALRQLARVEQDAARMHASAPRSDEKAPQGKAAAPAAAEPVPRSAPARATISAARPLALLDLARTRALEPLEISVLRAQENRERAGSQPQSAGRVLLSAPPAAPVQDAPVQRAQHPVSARQPVHPAASEKPAAPSRPAAPAQTVLRKETPPAPPRPAAVHSGTPAQADARRDARSTDLKLPVPPVSAAPAARDIRTAQGGAPGNGNGIADPNRITCGSRAEPGGSEYRRADAPGRPAPCACPDGPAHGTLRRSRIRPDGRARNAQGFLRRPGADGARRTARADRFPRGTGKKTRGRCPKHKASRPHPPRSERRRPRRSHSAARSATSSRRRGRRPPRRPRTRPVPGRMAADRVLRRDAAAQEQRRTQVSQTTQTPQKAHSAQAAPRRPHRKCRSPRGRAGIARTDSPGAAHCSARAACVRTAAPGRRAPGDTLRRVAGRQLPRIRPAQLRPHRSCTHSPTLRQRLPGTLPPRRRQARAISPVR